MSGDIAPEPIAFHSRGPTYVAEVFPAKARLNTSDRARVHMYEVGHPGTTWRVDARRRWTGAIRRGSRDEFPALQAILTQRFPNELAETWSNSLRFSSLTDMLPR